MLLCKNVMKDYIITDLSNTYTVANKLWVPKITSAFKTGRMLNIGEGRWNYFVKNINREEYYLPGYNAV
jgi:hypothetical protein